MCVNALEVNGTVSRHSYLLCTIADDSSWTGDLKERYCNYKLAQDDFPPVPTYSFTNLALIKDTTETHKDAFFHHTFQGSADDVIETKVSITYNKLLESITPPANRIILLEGRPGCGKTTLMRKFSKDWAEGTFLNFVRYLFLIPLRQFFNTPIISLRSILEYFFIHHYHDHISDLETEITRNRGKGTCFLFDGIDEYSQRYSKDGHSWFEDLLRGNVLTSSVIVITSRPNASQELRKSAHTRGEVLGILKDQIAEYIDRNYTNHPAMAIDVKSYLRDHQNIQHMCYIPLHLVVIILINDNCHKDKTPLPKTETEVYNLFTIMSLVRYFSKMDKDFVLNDLQSLPPHESNLLMRISKLAYINTTQSNRFLSIQELGPEISIPDMANLGILVVDRKVGCTDAQPIVSFVDLTIQEFLAAYHVSRLTSDEQLKAIKEHVVQPHMGVVLKFFCGLTKLHSPNHWAEILNNALIIDEGDTKMNLRALHCVLESQNNQRCKELFAKAEGNLVIMNETLSLLDYYAIGYCIKAASDHINSIELRCQINSEGLDIITQRVAHSMNCVKKLR